MPTIRHIRQDIIQQLSKDDVEKLFAKSNNDVFKHLHEINILDDIKIPIGNPNINRKGVADSEAFRNEGNRLYRAKQFEPALLAYNYALVSAPHPTETIKSSDAILLNDVNYKSKCTDEQYSQLAFAFANRSALLLELEQYQLSLTDIHCALFYGYTHSKKYKMFERKIKCLIGLEKFEEAKNLSKSLLANCSNIQINQKEVAQIKTNLEKYISTCSADNTGNNVSSSKSNVKTSNFSSLFHQGIELSQVSPSKDNAGRVSTALQIQHSASKGRHLVAIRDVSPGEVLIVEPSLCSFVLFDQRLRQYCSVCLKRATVPLPCTTCSLAVFCSSSCQEADAALSGGSHALMCPLLPSLVALQPELDAGLAFKTITNTNMQTIRNQNFVHKQNQINLNYSTISKNVENIGKNLESEHNVNEFLFALEGNQRTRTLEDRRDTAITAMILTKLLLNVPKFWNTTELSGNQTLINSIDFSLLTEHIMHILFNIQCNAHCVKELQIRGEKTSNTNLLYNDVGYAVYQNLSLLNHSCIANTHQSSNGQQKILYAVSCIRKGEEVTLSYGERYVSHSRDLRRQNLSKTYYFKCDCIACRLEWPVYQDLPINFSLRCSKCNDSIDHNTFKCKKCQLLHKGPPSKKDKKNKKHSNSFPNVYDGQKCLNEISQAWSDYNEAFKNITTLSNKESDLNVVTKLISLMDKYAHHPNKPYIEAQETIIRWFDQRPLV